MNLPKILTVCGAVCFASPSTTEALNLIANGGFESGFANWTHVDQLGSDGSFLEQSGAASPLNAFPVPPPPEGSKAAMTDSFGPGSHVLYQDFVVPGGMTGVSLGFSLFINNGGPDFLNPDTLDFATPALNQQARVDIMRITADTFSVSAGDILQNFFQTVPGDALVSGYNSFLFDVTALLQAHEGETLRLRFAEVDNVNFFNLGVDAVAISTSATVPDATSAMLLLPMALLLVVSAKGRQSIHSQNNCSG